MVIAINSKYQSCLVPSPGKGPKRTKDMVCAIAQVWKHGKVIVKPLNRKHMKLKILALMAGVIAIVNLSAQQTDSLKTIHLNEVTVSAFRIKSDMRELPQNVQVLKRRDIQEIPNESAGELLKKTAGVDILEYPGFSSNVGMRGYSPTAHGNTYTLTLVNGIPAGTQNISTIDLTNAEQVEILKGPYSAFFGSGAMAGVVNIVGPQSRGTLKGSASLSAGSFQTLSAKAAIGGSISTRLNFDLSLNTLHQGKDYKTGSNNFLKTSSYEKEIMDNTYGKSYENTTYDKYNGSLRLGYDIDKNWQVNLYENVFVANKILTNGNFWGTYGSNEKDIERWSQSISIEGSKGNHALKLTPYLNNEDVNYYNNISDTNYVDSKYNYKSYGFIMQDGITIGNHRLIVGIDNHSQKYVNKLWSKRDTRKAPYQPDYANIANGIYMQSRFNFFDNKLNAAVGVRYDLIYFKLYKTDLIESKNANEKYQTVNPNVSIRYGILPGLNIHAGIGTAFLAPDAFKKTGTYISSSKVYMGNPDLDPETSLSGDLGISYNNHGIEAAVTWFDTKHKGLIVYNYTSKDTTSFVNADDSKMSGLELALGYDFGQLIAGYSLKIYGNLTHILKSEVTTNDKTSDMKYTRKNNGSFGIEIRNKKSLAVRLNGRYIGHRFEDNWLYGYDSKTYNPVPLTDANGNAIRPTLINEAVLEHPDFMVFDLSGSYTLLDKFTFGVAVQNLLDENYTEKDNYNMPGRMISGTFTFSF